VQADRVFFLCDIRVLNLGDVQIPMAAPAACSPTHSLSDLASTKIVMVGDRSATITEATTLTAVYLQARRSSWR